MEEEVELKRETKFRSPIPLLIKFRNLIFGKERPDVYTQITFYINLIIWLTFMLWSMISYFTIASREMILQMKGIKVETIIETRGRALGFEGDEFLSRLLTFHAIGIICWALVFIGLVLLYRKKKQFVYFVLFGSLFYFGMTVFYLGFTYFLEDTTSYDKVALIIIIASTIVHAYLLNNESTGGSISFFGEAEEDESTSQ